MARASENPPAGRRRAGRERATSNIGSANLDEPLPGDTRPNEIERSALQPVIDPSAMGEPAGVESASGGVGEPSTLGGSQSHPQTLQGQSDQPQTSGNGDYGDGLTDEDRRGAIARAAYYKAEQRGFAPGHEIEDWLEAERELARQPGSPGIV